MSRKSTNLTTTLTVLFFVSGAAGLGCQIAWVKAFTTGIGHEFPAVLAVITAFFSGMALGAAVSGSWKSRWLEYSTAYGWLELIIGLWIVSSAFLIPPVNHRVTELLGISPLAWMHWAIVFIAVFLTLLPATAAMGATLPAIERFVSAATGRKTTGMLYGVNTAGAMTGAILTPFWLMPTLGIHHTILLLGGSSAACGAIALWIVRSESFKTKLERTPTGPDTHLTKTTQPVLALRLVLSGFLALGFETVAIRGLSHILENTVYTFATALAIYLLGNAIGATLYQRSNFLKSAEADRYLFVALAGCCLAGGLWLRWLPRIYESLRTALGDSLAAVAFAESLISAALLLLPCIVMGANFSALADRSLLTRRNLGWALSLNTTGAAVAPMIFGILLLPALGLRTAFAAIAVGYALLVGKSRLLIAAPLIAFLGLFVTKSSDLIQTHGGRILSLKEGVMASVSVLESTNGARVLKVNNRFQMGGTAARIAEERQAHIPLLLHPSPQRALFIGLGTGITFAASRHYPNLIADGVELLPEVADAMRYFVDATDSQNRLRFHVADGRRFVQVSTNQYDVIVSDLFHPAQDGAGFLYTQENFTAIRNRLNPSGLFCQWLPLHQMDLPTLRSIIRTFLAVFPNGEGWLLRFTADTPVIGLISRHSPVPTKSVPDSIPAYLSDVALGDSVRLFGCFLASTKELSIYSHGAPLNRDQNPVVLFQAPHITFRQQDDPAARLLELLERFKSDVTELPLVGNPSEVEPLLAKTSDFIKARNVYLHGLVLEQRGHSGEAVARYIESARLSPDFTMGYAQALGIAASLSPQKPEVAKSILRQLMDARPELPVARQLLERLEPNRQPPPGASSDGRSRERQSFVQPIIHF